ncbi:MAG: hypothetical protein K6E19_06210 [Lachnospiraceae bacterium]|nr:hypothetical protein [Lachnospiraceae bacterium]
MKTRERSLFKALILAFLLITVLFMIFKLRAEAKERFFSEERFACENEYKAEVREILLQHGIKNAGINITATSLNGVHYDYEILIHLPSYINLDAERERALTGAITELGPVTEFSSSQIIFS